MPERVMKQSHSRLLRWYAQLPFIRWMCTPQVKQGDLRRVDHGAIGFFHALVPALLISLLLWGLLFLL